MGNRSGLFVVDAHAHLYECFDISLFIENAYSNLKSNFELFGQTDSFAGILVLMDTSEAAGFQRGLNLFRQSEDSLTTGPRTWELSETREKISLHLISGRDESLIIIAGRQLVSQEKLEVLAVGTRRRFDEGQPAKKLIRDIAAVGALPILPWGVGKWWGKRGRLVDKLIRSPQVPQFFLGDSANRPVFWPRPAQFSRAEEEGIKNLSGSDPLPFPEEAQRVGSFGVALDGSLNLEKPGQDLKRRLLDPSTTLHQFGSGETPLRFVRNQLEIQLRKLTR